MPYPQANKEHPVCHEVWDDDRFFTYQHNHPNVFPAKENSRCESHCWLIQTIFFPWTPQHPVQGHGKDKCTRLHMRLESTTCCSGCF
jgi:hypothetical protein